MAAAVHFDIPLSLVQNTLNNISLDALTRAATTKYDNNDASARELQGQLQIQINNMGTLYKAIFETHIQRSKINGGSVSYSPFGFDHYENFPIDRFRSKYGVISSQWPSAGYGNRTPGWISTYIRNSIAHNHTSVRLEGGYLVVTVANSQNGIAPDFELSMGVKDYIRMIAHSAKDHIDGCRICTIYTESPRTASAVLKAFLAAVFEGRKISGMVKDQKLLNMVP